MNIMKKILVVVFALVVLSSSSIAYAWWDRLSFENAETDLVLVGKGLELIVLPVTINPLTNGNLIPQSAVLTQNSTYAIELHYTVRLNESVSDALNLSVTVTDIKVNEVENPFNLLYVEVSHNPAIANDDVFVALTVRIDDSNLQEENYDAAYVALANKNITFNVNFLVS